MLIVFRSGKSFMPIIGNQSYHFNTSSSENDAARKMKFQKHFDKAVKWGRRAKSWRTNQKGFNHAFKQIRKIANAKIS